MSQVRICIDECMVQFSVITKKLSSNLISLKYLLIEGNVILIWTQDILQFGKIMDRRSLKQNYNESLAMSLFGNSLFFTFFVCSSCSLCSSCIFPFWGFVVCEVSGGFWAWFQWPLRSRKMIWMISLRMFFVFAYVIAYTRWTACVIAYTRWCVIGFCITFGKFLLVF